MAEVREVKDGDVVLACHVRATAGWTEGLAFFFEDRDLIQFGAWGYERDKQLKTHSHNLLSRAIFWTQEVIYMLRGCIRAQAFELSEQQRTSIEVVEGEILTLQCGGHRHDILEDSTQVLEVTKGPDVGADQERRRL